MKAAERERRCEQDDNPLEGMVSVSNNVQSGRTELYHKTLDDGMCRHLKKTAEDPRQMSRAAAQARGKAPCVTCHPGVTVDE